VGDREPTTLIHRKPSAKNSVSFQKKCTDFRSLLICPVLHRTPDRFSFLPIFL